MMNLKLWLKTENAQRMQRATFPKMLMKKNGSTPLDLPRVNFAQIRTLRFTECSSFDQIVFCAV